MLSEFIYSWKAIFVWLYIIINLRFQYRIIYALLKAYKGAFNSVQVLSSSLTTDVYKFVLSHTLFCLYIESNTMFLYPVQVLLFLMEENNVCSPYYYSLFLMITLCISWRSSHQAMYTLVYPLQKMAAKQQTKFWLS